MFNMIDGIEIRIDDSISNNYVLIKYPDLEIHGCSRTWHGIMCDIPDDAHTALYWFVNPDTMRRLKHHSYLQRESYGVTK